MTRYAKSLVLAMCGLLIAASASAEIPLPSRDQSTFPVRGVYLVGSNDATVDAAGEFSVTVRDGNGQTMGPPLPVTIDFSACSPDIRLAPQTFPGLTVTGCQVTATINALGVAKFRIRGGALNPGNGPGAAYRCAVLSSAGVYLNNLSVAAFDQTGNLDGVKGSDLAAWNADFFAAPQQHLGRSDFNFDENLTGADLAMLIGNFFSGGSAENGGALAGCP